MQTPEEIVATTRDRLGPVGVWSAVLRQITVPERQAVTRRIEELGYGSVWAGEGVGGTDAFAGSAVALCASERIVVGTGIANLWARHPATMQAGAATLGAAWPGRFILGVGVSHAPLVVRSGQDYARPLDRMADYLAAMDEAAAEAPVTPVPVPRVLAALRLRMLELARERAHGAHPYFVPPAHIPVARAALGPNRLLIPEQAVVLTTDPAEGRRVAREHMAMYLRLPNYVNNLHEFGFGDEDIASGGSDRLVDAIVAWGDDKAIADRVRELRDSGADHVLLQPLAKDGAGLVGQLERLAPAVLS